MGRVRPWVGRHRGTSGIALSWGLPDSMLCCMLGSALLFAHSAHETAGFSRAAIAAALGDWCHNSRNFTIVNAAFPAAVLPFEKGWNLELFVLLARTAPAVA